MAVLRAGGDSCRLQEIRDAEIRMRAFAAAEADVSSKDDFSSQEECEAAAESLMEIREIQIAASDGDFAGVVEREDSDGADDAAIVFRLNKK